MANILLVEDDIDIAGGIAEYLEAQGHQLDFAYNGRQAIEHLDNHSYQLVLLDINLPMLDGLSVCRTLVGQKLARIPVIMMSARGETADIVSGFDAGAWDYLVKPFSFAELSARVGVALAKPHIEAADIRTYQGVAADKNSLSISYRGESLQLHSAGFEILWLLLANAPKVVKTAQIHQQLWAGQAPQSDPLRAHVYKLRKQLAATFKQEFIVTVKGAGYRFDVQP